jgi:hypothetical protein
MSVDGSGSPVLWLNSWMKGVDQAVEVTRVGDQPVLGADREQGQEVHHH